MSLTCSKCRVQKHNHWTIKLKCLALNRLLPAADLEIVSEKVGQGSWCCEVSIQDIDLKKLTEEDRTDLMAMPHTTKQGVRVGDFRGLGDP